MTVRLYPSLFFLWEWLCALLFRRCFKVTTINRVRERGYFPKFQSSRKFFQVCRTKCPAGLQCPAGHFNPLSDIFTSLMSSKYYILCRTFPRHFPWKEPCRTKCPAMFEPTAGHQQKSAGHVRHVQHISRGLKFFNRHPTFKIYLTLDTQLKKRLNFTSLIFLTVILGPLKGVVSVGWPSWHSTLWLTRHWSHTHFWYTPLWP